MKDCCDKLSIQFHRDNYKKFWFQIDIGEIHAASVPNKLYPMINLNGFACFSVFFTCSEESAGIFETKINQYFYKNSHVLGLLYFVSNLKLTFSFTGQYKGYDFTRNKEHNSDINYDIMFASSITDFHLELICRWFNCRILVFKNGTWERFGTWGPDARSSPLFIIENKNGKYYPVLALKN